MPILGNAVTAACDGIDGIADGVLDDPRKCKFDPAVLTCGAGQDPATCFTPKQVQAIKDIWSGARDVQRVSSSIRPCPRRRNRSGRLGRVTSRAPAPAPACTFCAADGFFSYMVFENPAYDFRHVQLRSRPRVALAKVGRLSTRSIPICAHLIAAAKLIVYHGWNDPSISPINTVNYYESVVRARRASAMRREAALERTQ